jgi:hypothetical protein
LALTILTHRDVRVLQAVFRFRLLSRDQIRRLGPFGSITRVNTRLAALVNQRLLARKRVPIIPGHGDAQTLYFLLAGAAQVLAMDSTTVMRLSRTIARWDSRQVAHVLAANQVLVDLVEALRAARETTLLDFRTEPELRTQFLDRQLVPDGWVAWIQDGRRYNGFLEIDLHHEGLGQWRKKVLDYLAYAEAGHHTELFRFKAFRVFVVAKSRTRLDHLRKVAQPAGRLFLFATFDELRPDTILQGVWEQAAATDRTTLMQA